MTCFRFKQFEVADDGCGMKIGTDGVLLGAWAGRALKCQPQAAPLRICDVGTGCGVIALMLAQRFPSARIDAVEIDPEAAREAAYNVSASPFASRIRVVNADVLKWQPEEGYLYDLIVSNPPFFNNGALSPKLQRLNARHELTLTLSNLFEKVRFLLHPQGTLTIITPADRRCTVEFEAAMNHFFARRATEVSTVSTRRPKRLLWEFALGENQEAETTELTIQAADGRFSDEYKNLTKDFYLDF